MNIAELQQTIVDTLRARLPALATVDFWQEQMTPETLRTSLAAQRLPGAFVALAGYRSDPSRFANFDDCQHTITWVAFVVIPGRKGEAPPLGLLQDITDLVRVEGFGLQGPELPTLDRAEYLFGFDGGRDWVSVYAVRWTLKVWLR
ncbi:MAG: hypothetical protein HQL37_09495 [Alphaproteobacteria bacterium]|nr:hypothetical protein [Alphaproteobacteria bacterium]